MTARREFLLGTAALAGSAAAGSAAPPAVASAPTSRVAEDVSLCGEWLFRTDPEDRGSAESWFATGSARTRWREVRVPHTWQVEAATTEFRGVAWYSRGFDVPERWAGCAVRLEFEAVYHTATVWVNGRRAGEHARKGYTSFTLDIASFLEPGSANSLVVRVDSSFDEHMLPRGRSSDFPHDGGIFRPVRLLVTPQAFIERVHVEATPDLGSGEASLAVVAHIRNTATRHWKGRASFRVLDEDSGREVLRHVVAEPLAVGAAGSQTLSVAAKLAHARLWHFDHPHLYRLEFLIADAAESHALSTTFGVRKLEVRHGSLCLNGERVRLMGVERMAGSNPAFGMAEPESWITHDHDDLKHLNCVFTRVHWPQDTRVLDYCDRHGILVQSEIPAWGSDTFKGMGAEPDADILENGLEQMREMIARDRNHPCIVLWGLCNEVGGQQPPAYQFAKRLAAEVKELDPGRLCSYASNSLEKNPQRDVAALMDVIEMNEYVGTWAPGNLDTIRGYLDAAHAAFPGKPIIISEYGYCACVPERPEDDTRRIATLRSHDGVFRSRDFVAGAIFFCYNDYRSQAGFSGTGALKQNVHGVVDVFGRRKPSFEALRAECSPVLTLSVDRHGNSFRVLVGARGDLPAHILRGYLVRAISYGEGQIPLEQQTAELPDIAPGDETVAEVSFALSTPTSRFRFDVLRPNGFSALTREF